MAVYGDSILGGLAGRTRRIENMGQTRLGFFVSGLFAASLGLSTLGQAAPPGGVPAGLPLTGVSLAPYIDTSTYRIGMSHDGNQHDKDDILAVAMAMAIIGEADLVSKFVHCDYSNHLGDNNASQAAEMVTSATGAAQRWGLPSSKVFDCQASLSGAVTSIKNAINASSSGNRFYYACGGPMEVPWRGINASDAAKRQYCTAVSHSTWNETHADTTQMTHTWSHIQSSGVKTVRIKDQNAGMSTAVSNWTWLRDSSVEAWKWLFGRNKKSTTNFDASDAGMVYYIITGRGDQDGNAAKIKDLFMNGPGGPGGGGDPASQAVTGFTLVNADTDKDIQPLLDGATLNLATLPTRNLNVRADTDPATVGSVRFSYDGNAAYRTENAAPYALAGDSSGNYAAWTPSVGAHTLTATPYTGSGATGTAGSALSVVFSVVESAGNQPPIVSLTSPSGGATFTAPATIAISASASDPDGTVNMVEFFQGTTRLATDTSAPYGTTWTNVAAGTYTLRARATDNGALSADSAPVTITVQAAPSGPAVTSFTLINADTDQPVAGHNPMAGGAVIDLVALPTRNLNIRANTSPSTVGSVRFGYDGNPNYRLENAAPYAMAGDTSGNYFAWTPSIGSHSVTATPYTLSKGGGTAGTPLTLAFTVVDGAGKAVYGVAELEPGGEEYLDPDGAAASGGSDDGGGACGATGAETLVILGLLALARRFRA